VSGTRLGQRIGRSVPTGLRVPGPRPLRVPGNPGSHELVRMTTRMVLAQAAVAVLVGLPFSRRQVWTIAMSLTLAAALLLLAAVARTGTPAARNVVLFFEVFIAAMGLYEFFTARYLGGTLFAIVVSAILLHPAVGRAYGSVSGQPATTEALPTDGGATLGSAGTVTCGDPGVDRLPPSGGLRSARRARGRSSGARPQVPGAGRVHDPACPEARRGRRGFRRDRGGRIRP
jgi:hypothetical protein